MTTHTTIHAASRQALFTLLLVTAARGQAVPAAVPLAPPTATAGEVFTRVSGVRELSDGRVLVVDQGDNRLLVVDMRGSSAREIGRQGGGVGEHGPISQIFALAADSSLVPDGGNGRWLLMHRDSIVAMLAADAPAVRAIGRTLLGADLRGSVASTRPRFVNGLPRLDSLMILKGSRSQSGVDTVGLIYVRPPTIQGGGRIDPTRAVPVSFNPLSANEQALLFRDGWLAVARLAPYRVEWIAPGGKTASGPTLPFERVRVTDEERVEVLMRESRQTGRPPRPLEEVADWPEFVPPFIGQALLAGPDGSLWILRAPSRGARRNDYDVVGRNGALVRRVTMPESERVVGFGETSVYTVATDDDGIQRLRRHLLQVRVTRFD
jgi:hypothetical protein